VSPSITRVTLTILEIVFITVAVGDGEKDLRLKDLRLRIN